MVTETATYKRDRRNNTIDLIRGLSIISVILLHINILIPFEHCQLGKLLPQSVFNIIFRSGYYGVMVFFVVSGFLIMSTSLKRWGNLSNIRISQFYQMRFARIAPCFIGLLIILSVAHIIGIKGFVITTTTLDKAIFSALTFHINWLEAKTGYLPGTWDVLWSLSVEETFYIFFPLVCLLARNEFIFKLAMVVFIILGPFARYMFSDNEIWSDHSYLSCMDGIAVGCLAALYINKFKISFRSSLFFVISGLLLFLFIFIFRHQAYQLGLSKVGLNVTILEIGIALILIATNGRVIQHKRNGNWFAGLFQWFGKNSYEIYLTHMLVLTILAQAFFGMKMSNSTMLFWYLGIISLSGVSGNLIAKYFSEPLNRYLRFKPYNIGHLNYLKD